MSPSTPKSIPAASPNEPFTPSSPTSPSSSSPTFLLGSHRSGSGPATPIDWWLNKIIFISCSCLLGSFFTHWVVDYPILWTGPSVSPRSIEVACNYYGALIETPFGYVLGLGLLSGSALLACLIKLVMNPLKGMLFDGASFLLLASGLSVYASNIRTALNYLPGIVNSTTGTTEIRTTEALQSIAASNLIICVSLTGILALQAAQGHSDRRPKPVQLVRG